MVEFGALVAVFFNAVPLVSYRPPRQPFRYTCKQFIPTSFSTIPVSKILTVRISRS